MDKFLDRRDAGQRLAQSLAPYVTSETQVLGLPRGGVPVAYEVAKALHLALDVLIVRKLGVPGREELAMGAIASGGVKVLHQDVIEELGIGPASIEKVIAQETHEVQRRERRYRARRPVLKDIPVILVDDGIATGATMQAAIRVVKQAQPSQIIVAAPVCAPDTFETLQSDVDRVVCLLMPDPFLAVGLWYQDFPQTSDEEVQTLLEQARQQNKS